MYIIYMENLTDKQYEQMDRWMDALVANGYNLTKVISMDDETKMFKAIKFAYEYMSNEDVRYMRRK